MKKIIITLCLFAPVLSVYTGGWYDTPQVSIAKHNALVERELKIKRDQKDRVDFAENLDAGLKKLDQGHENSFIKGLFFQRGNLYADLLECFLGDAVVYGKLNRVKKLLSIGVPARGKFRGLPLLVLASNSRPHTHRIDIILLLLDSGANRGIILHEIGDQKKKHGKSLIDSIQDNEVKKVLKNYGSKSKSLAYKPADEFCVITEFLDDEDVPSEYTDIRYRTEIPETFPAKQIPAVTVASSSQVHHQAGSGIIHQNLNTLSSTNDHAETSYLAKAVDFIKSNKVATTFTAALLAGLAYKFMQSQKTKKSLKNELNK